jgi:hypothetical protein
MAIHFVTSASASRWPDIADLDRSVADREPNRFRSGIDGWIVWSYLLLRDELAQSAACRFISRTDSSPDTSASRTASWSNDGLHSLEPYSSIGQAKSRTADGEYLHCCHRRCSKSILLGVVCCEAEALGRWSGPRRADSSAAPDIAVRVLCVRLPH